MRVLAIDPGNKKSAFVVLRDGQIEAKGKVDNAVMLETVRQWASDLQRADECVLEMVASYGMRVGAEVFETVFWTGRFAQLWESERGRPAHRLFRLNVKVHLCHDSRAKDANIRQALIDRYGPGKDVAIGRKAEPGPLFGVSADEWSALAIGVTFADAHATAEREFVPTHPEVSAPYAERRRRNG